MRLSSSQLIKSLLVVAMLSIAVLQLYRQRVPPAFNLPAVASVQTTHSIVGIHTRLMGLDEATIRRTLQQVREMGATTIIDLFPWAVIQPRSGNSYEWTGSDMLIAHAQRQGLTVIARLDFVPAWARPANTNDRYIDPDHYAAYADFVAAFAQRYVPQGVRVLQIWNEPNLRFEWGDRAPDPVAYANLLKAVYPRVKAVAPEALITLAGLAPGGPTGPIDPQTLSVNDLTFLALCLAEKPPFDAVSVHAYGSINPAEQAPEPSITNFRRTELIHDLVTAAGYDVPFYITEGGWNDHPRWPNAVPPPIRVQNTLAAYEWAEEHWPWMQTVGFWQFSLPNLTYTYADNYTFVAPDGTPKAIYYAVQQFTQQD
ncbi:GH39 family glycosyl hydrolase [Herpetosiphon llansteffanensis]|uniref:GH39 family glycosyl hydrolase n=1 Tax=Herpetosiphon llansteffanensis TaxID=2094568 RepID=UPI000D7CC737|nr:hypothetical protein [Herpetosiphon llansteffanensis]